MNISNRLNAVSNMVTPGNIVADIGTDHGYVPMFLIKNKISPHVIAMDINRGPIEMADVHIKGENLGDKIETRLSDGLTEFHPGEADTIIIAGMGGELIISILEHGAEKLKDVSEIILSPHSFIKEVREKLFSIGFSIADEQMIFEDKKYYTIMRAERGSIENYNRAELSFGKILLMRKNDTLKNFLLKQQKKYNNILLEMSRYASDNNMSRQHEIKEEIDIISEALEYYK